MIKFENKTICPTSLFQYIKETCHSLHGHQIKGIADFVFSIIQQQSGVQAELAKIFGNQEAACKRLSRLLHNRRLSPKQLSELVFEQVLRQLPKHGKIRLAFDWTIENEQYLLVISLVQQGRAIPIFWRGYEERVLKKRMKIYERMMLKRVLEKLQASGVSADRIILTADRGFACVETFRLLKKREIAFVIRVKYSTLIELEGEWRKLSRVEFQAGKRRKNLGRVKYCKRSPEELEMSVSRLSEVSKPHENWYLVSNKKWSAKKMAQEYAKRFGCEEGFRDVKWSLGFSESRIKDIKAWSRMFGLMSLAMMVLASLGSKLLLGEEGKAKKMLRKVASRRKGKWEVSLISATIALLKQEKNLYEHLNPYIKFNLERSLQNVS